MGCRKLTYNEFLPTLKVVSKNLNISLKSCTDDYRYAFNGMEFDDEIQGGKNSYTTEFRQYDVRIARWRSLDPVTHPHFSPYSAFDNNPIYFADPSGADSEGGPEKQDPVVVGDETKYSHSKQDFWNRTEFTITSTRVISTIDTETGDVTTSTTVTSSTTTTYKDGRAMNFGKPVVTNLPDVVQSYQSLTGKAYDKVEIALEGYRNSEEFKSLSQDSQGSAESQMRKHLDGTYAKRQAYRKRLSETVIGFLPQFQIASGIQEIQEGNPWGWLRIGLQIIPLPAGKLLSPIVRFEATAARGTMTLLSRYQVTAMWNFRSGIGVGFRASTSSGRMFGAEIHTFGMNNPMYSAFRPVGHFHYGQAGIFSMGNHLPLNTPLQLGFKNTLNLFNYGVTKKSGTYQMLQILKF